MNQYLPQPGSRPPDLVTLVNERRRASIEYVRERYRETEIYDRAFRGICDGKAASYLNDIVPPIILATVMSDVARKTNSMFGSWPVVTFQGVPGGSEGIAKKNELLINLQLHEAESYRKSVTFFMQADINGTAVADVGWSQIKRLRQFRTYVPGTSEMIDVRDTVTEFDGPTWKPRDLLTFLPEPGKTNVSDMNWYIETDYVDFDDLLELNSADGFQSFSPEAIKALSQTAIPGPRSASDDFMTLSRYRNFGDYLKQTGRTNSNKPVELWTMYGTVPYEFAPDGVRRRVITIGNGSVVMRNDPDRLLLNRHRVVTYSPTPDPYHFVGIGKAKIAEPLQAAAGRLMNQKLDAFDLFIKPAFLVEAGALASQNMFVKPGKAFQVRTKGRALGDVIQALPVNLQPLAMAFQEIAFLDGMIQKGTGISESAVMGLDTGQGDKTARQFVGEQEAAMTRLAMEAGLASVEVVEPIAELMRDMNKTLLPLPKQFSMIGTRAIFNPVTGLPLEPEEGMISNPMELNHSWKAKAFGPSFMLTKSASKADAVQLAQVMMQNPVWIQNLNWLAMAKKIFSLYDWNVDEMMVRNPIVNQMAQQMGQDPAAMVGQIGQNPLSAFGGAGGQQMSPIQQGGDMVDNAPLGVGP